MTTEKHPGTSNDSLHGIFHRRFILLCFLVAALFFPQKLKAQDLITITGSSMLYPLEKIWKTTYEKKHSGTRIELTATGSGMGFRQSYRGDVSIGASDVYATANIKKQFPGLVSIPVAMEDVEIVYNLPGIPKTSPLRLDGKVLSLIFLGAILTWDDPLIARENPALSLPHRRIRLIHRNDASGTTFVLTDYLSNTSRKWKDAVGRDMAPLWPKGRGVNGSEQLAATVSKTPWSLGYEGHNWVKKSGLTSAALKNHDGYYVRGTVQSIINAGQAAGIGRDYAKDLTRSIVWWPRGKNVYPAANFEYWMVNPHMDAESMKAVRHLTGWILGPGQALSLMKQAGFAPVPIHSSRPLLRKVLRELIPGNAFKVVPPG